jgi:hypothetical protein
VADSTIAVTAGSGTNLHSWSKTISATTVHDEFTLPGEYPYASYVVIAENISVGTANDHVLQLMAGASLNVKVRRIYYEQLTNATTAAAASVGVYRLTTAGTGGSSVTPARFDNADSAAGATAMTLPSSKGTESTLLHRQAFIYRQAIGATTAQIDDRWEWVQLPNMKPIVIPAGTTNGIAIKTLSAVATATVNVHIEFVEQTFVGS